ncbi:hypothetical protein [Prauserella muralis]|uniref:Uncharacterized protein n=1 Tax=Prauserella muralis TaxID=588067 RepID=A0A2V4AYN3_9PSEU|nr:hypothetical protein [Prauserella muralis]PXY26937.1 hypothetical protein BAY60_10560 [Prauserella muralis]TWE23451.1 putative secreted protein with PEP-CTERM sorting signal [Prauserella muralis]
MPGKTAKRDRPKGLYVHEVKLSLRNNAGAYGYSVMITCSLAMLSTVHSTPEPGQIFLFVLGGGASFLLVEAIATSGFRRSLQSGESTTVVALGTALSALSISVGVGAAWLVAVLLPVTLGWFVASFAASVVYLLLSALEMGFARRVEEARNVE